MSKDKKNDFTPYDDPTYYPQLTSGVHIVTISELVIFSKYTHLSRITKAVKKITERGGKRKQDYIITLDNSKMTCKLYTTDSFISRYEDDVF